MKKNFIKYIAALAVAPMLLSSCSDDFLNEIDPNRQTPTTFWTSEDNVMKGLSAVYNPFRRMTSGYYGGLEGIMHLQMRGDDLYPTRGEEPYIWEYLSFVNTTNTKDLSWGNIYEGIQMANEFIYRAATVDMDETKREQMIGEAYESGADGFISKPFNLSVLHARISNLLRSRERMGKDFKKQLVFEAKELNYTSVDEDFLQRAIDCVHRHLDDPDFDQAKLLEEMYMAKSTFFRKLKSLTGLTYVSFIRNIRMKAACRIMEEKKNIRISELAYAVGYNDPRYFSNSFKKEFGMQPSEYMERFTSNGTVEDDVPET